MSHNTIDQLVGQLKSGQISRRGFVRRATALGISASAAGMLARGAVAQDASPAATSGEVIKSTTREEYFAALASYRLALVSPDGARFNARADDAVEVLDSFMSRHPGELVGAYAMLYLGKLYYERDKSRLYKDVPLQ